ncbi:MAG: RNA helicase, partial [Acidimicrobiia bacterium]|nr:RNA helicase [Acidimicrobiia bacterium]
TPRRIETVERLGAEGMLPAIYFIFSRAGCDAAAIALAESGVRLVDSSNRSIIRRIAEERTAHLSDRDLDALDFGRWLATLETGAAAHHAGLVPAFKETVEELFSTGLLKVVFATETLALGINMPARSVVLESLSKFDGEGHSLMEPGDFTQLTGRAGRRGIDTEGFGVLLHSRYVRFDQVTQIASLGAHPLRSSFRPTYNMAANLVANYDEPRAQQLLTASFAQFQRHEADEASHRHLEEMEVRLGDEVARAECELGSVASLVAAVDRSETPRARNLGGTLHPGDVVDVPGGPRSGRYVVLRRVARGKKGLRLLVMGTSGRVSTIGSGDLVPGSTKSGTVEFPRPFVANDRKFQQIVLRRLRVVPDAPRAVGEGRPQRVDHPVASCPRATDHIKWFRRAERTRKRIDQHRAKLREQGIGLVEDFDSIRSILDDWEYLDGWSLTARGQRLRFVYNEMDLLLTEATERGYFWSLDPRELAAVASFFVYEPRTDRPAEPRWPSPVVEERYRLITELWEELVVTERHRQLPMTRRPEAGFAASAHAWASNRDLEDLPSSEFAPGDFVRVSRQLVDLLRQLRDGFPELAEEGREALSLVDRGVVAAQGVS